MGGIGSGRHGHRAIIEAGLTIDLRRLHQQGEFISGACAFGRVLHWSRGDERIATVNFSYDASAAPTWFRVSYNATSDGRPVAVDEQFELEAFPQPFGGRRWYFICPSTGARVQTLHCPPGATRFRSRQAFRGQVRYLSQGLDRGERKRRQADKLRRRMFAAGPSDWCEEHADWEFPPKPPGMRWGTYSQAFERWEGFDADADCMAMERVMRIFGRTGG